MGRFLDISSLPDAGTGNDNYKVFPVSTGHIGGGNSVQEIVNAVHEDTTVHYMTNGAWSHHELIEALTIEAGTATLYVSSYAMSEEAVRTLLRLRDGQLLQKLHCVIDNRIETRTAKSLQLLQSISDTCVLVPCHAKVTVIAGKYRTYLVLGSANYTENKRVETGIVVCDHEVALFHIEWILKIIDDAGK